MRMESLRLCQRQRWQRLGMRHDRHKMLRQRITRANMCSARSARVGMSITARAKRCCACRSGVAGSASRRSGGKSARPSPPNLLVWPSLGIKKAPSLPWGGSEGEGLAVAVDERVAPLTSASKPCLQVSPHTAPQLLSPCHGYVASVP